MPLAAHRSGLSDDAYRFFEKSSFTNFNVEKNLHIEDTKYMSLDTPQDVFSYCIYLVF